MTTFRHISAKKAWAKKQAEIAHYKFCFIGSLALLYKGGTLSKAEVVARMNEAGLSREDLQAFRKSCE